MIYKRERQEIIAYGNSLVTEQLTTGTGGNISLFIPEDKVMLISPSGIPYQEIQLADIVVLDLEGTVIDGSRKPSSEYDMHKIFYEKNPEVRAVVHTHSDYATSVACLQKEIPPLHYIIGSVGRSVRCCAYKTFGTQALAEEAYRVMGDNKGILLGNHGVLTVGSDLAEAFSIAKDIEFLAKLYVRSAALGEPVLLSEEELDVVVEKFKTYGQVLPN